MYTPALLYLEAEDVRVEDKRTIYVGHLQVDVPDVDAGVDRSAHRVLATSPIRSNLAPAPAQCPISSSSIAIRCPRPITCGCMQ